MKTIQQVQEALDRANRALDTITDPLLRKEVEHGMADNFQLEINMVASGMTAEKHYQQTLKVIKWFDHIMQTCGIRKLRNELQRKQN